MEINERIQELIEAKGWTVNKLAYESGLTASTLYSVMSGKVSPTIQTIEILCETLGIKLGDFFDESYELSPEEYDLLNNYNLLNEQEKRIVQNLTASILKWR